MDYGQAAIYLKQIYERINKDWFNSELPDVTISVMERAGTYGSFSLGKLWIKGTEQQHEINIAAGGLNRPIENVVATIVHEACHLYCYINGIQDTSNKNIYHNKRFKEVGEEHGLIISRHNLYGWTLTEPSEKLIIWCVINNLVDIDIYRADYTFIIGKVGGGNVGTDGANGGVTTKRKSSTRKYLCPRCKLSVRATKEVNIFCGDCMEKMEEDG